MKTKFLFFFLLLFVVHEAKTQINLQDGLVAYYPFNGNANDESGKGNNGTVNGATLTTDRFGNVGKAYSFNGENNNISFSTLPMENTDNWCISTWINPKSLNTIQTVLLFGVDDGVGGNPLVNGYSINLGWSGFLSYFYFIFSDISAVNSGYDFKSINQWAQFVVQRENGITSFYVNGVKMSNSSPITPRVPTQFIIGSSTGVRYFNGSIDDVRIYNRTLTIQEINYLYTMTPTKIDNLVYESLFDIYPNPATTLTTISSSVTINKIEIYDVSGQVVKIINVSNNKCLFNTRELSKGVYLVKGFTVNGVRTARLIKE